HRAAGVDDHRRLQVDFLVELLDVVPVALADNSPVNQSQFVPRAVSTVLGKLESSAALNRAVLAGEQTVDDGSRQDVEMSDPVEYFRVEQLISFFHRSRHFPFRLSNCPTQTPLPLREGQARGEPVEPGSV